MTLRGRIALVLVAIASVFAATLPAQATGIVLPPTIPDTPANRYLYSVWFSPTPAEWSPQGTLVADSGFRSQPNGLPYPNYGSSLASNQLFFNTPGGTAQGATPAALRALYGDGVCIPGTIRGSGCTLTPAAAYWGGFLDEASVNGHCYGFAASAAGAFNGQLPLASLSARTLTLQSRLTTATQQQLFRAWASQYTVPEIDTALPSEVVSTLLRTLRAGTLPWVLVLYWQGANGREGHAISPYAVYDRGGGVYDIAVYDNNYPGQQRAVHVDTVAQTWSYLVFPRPGTPGVIAQGDAATQTLGLSSVTTSLGRQPCPVCANGGHPDDLVGFYPIPTSQNGLFESGMITLDAKPLPTDRYHILPPLTPVTTATAPQDVFVVDPTGGYGIVANGERLTAAIPLRLIDTSGTVVRRASTSLAPGTVAGAFMPSPYALRFGASVPVVPTLSMTLSTGSRHDTVSALGGSAVAADNLRSMLAAPAQRRVYLGDVNAAGGSMSVRYERSTASGKATYAGAGAYPKGARLVLVYGPSPSNPTRLGDLAFVPGLWLDLRSDGTLDKRLPLRRV